MNLETPIQGSCQCEAVQFEIRQEPLTVYACHCTDCQRQSGSAFSLSMVVARDSLTVTCGKPKEWIRKGGSGQLVSCWFCERCGARLYHEPHANKAITIVKSGTLNNSRAFAPIGHIWTQSAHSWFELGSELIKYERQPVDRGALAAAWKIRREHDGLPK